MGLPLILVEEQRLGDDGVIVGRILWLMSESADPEPREVGILSSSPFRRNRSLYLGLRDGALLLWPALLWDIAEETRNYRLFFVDTVRENELKYKTVGVSVLDRNSDLIDRLKALFRRDRVPLEGTRLAEGQDFLAAWLGERKQIEAVVTKHGDATAHPITAHLIRLVQDPAQFLGIAGRRTRTPSQVARC